MAREGEKVNTGMKLFFTMDPEKIDLEKAARDAAQEAVAGLEAVQAASGSYRVLLRSDVAATLLSTFSGVFSADNAQRGLSRLKGREGEAIASGCVTLLDNPHLAGSAASAPFDGEGVATYEKAVIEDGRLNTLLHNLKTAHKQGVGTTANASRPGYAAPVGVAPTNFYFKPTDVSFDGMLEKLGDGLLITDLQGMHAGANRHHRRLLAGRQGLRGEGRQDRRPRQPDHRGREFLRPAQGHGGRGRRPGVPRPRRQLLRQPQPAGEEAERGGEIREALCAKNGQQSFGCCPFFRRSSRAFEDVDLVAAGDQGGEAGIADGPGGEGGAEHEALEVGGEEAGRVGVVGHEVRP